MKQQAFNPTQSKSNLETLMEQFVNQQIAINKQNEEQFKQINSKLEQIATHNRIFETQIAQQASSSNNKPLGKLPSQPEYIQKSLVKQLPYVVVRRLKGMLIRKRV